MKSDVLLLPPSSGQESSSVSAALSAATLTSGPTGARRTDGKTCTKCGTWRCLTEFYKNGDRLRADCKPCHAEYDRKRREENLEGERERCRKWRETHPGADLERSRRRLLTATGRASSLLRNARTRAKKRGLTLTLTVAWITERIEAGVCEATGLPFDLSADDKHHQHPDAPSLDRINSFKGYTPDNVRVVVWLFNVGTHQYDDAAYERVARAYLNRKDTP